MCVHAKVSFRFRPFTEGKAPAFTLIELLMAMAVSALLAGAAGFALGGKGGAHSLRTAQNLMSSALVAARNQAVLSRSNARLLVYSAHPDNPDVDRQLRWLQVAVEGAGGVWKAVGEPVWLPKTARLVPKSSPATPAGVTWGSAPTSRVSGDVALSVVSGEAGAVARYYYVEFTPLGNTTVATLIVSTANLEAGTSASRLVFVRPMDLRGIKISQYGAQTLLPTAAAF